MRWLRRKENADQFDSEFEEEENEEEGKGGRDDMCILSAAN